MSIRTFFLVFVLALLAQSLNAQSDTRIQVNKKNATVAQVLHELSVRYDLNFAYDSYELSRLSGSWSFTDKTVNEALDILLEPYDLEYKLAGSVYIIYPKVKIESEPLENIAPQELISGEIRDKNSGELLPFAAMFWQKASVSFTADAEGRFVYEGVIDPADTLTVFFVGYESEMIPGEKFRALSFHKIYLSPRRYYLPDVEVTARPSSPLVTDVQSVSFILNPAELNSRHGLGEPDLFRTAQLLPGVSATNESNNGLFIRGSNSDQTLITLDGFTIYHMDHLFGTFSAINSHAVKAMKLTSGPLDTRSGGRAAGALEMIGREGNRFKPDFKLDLGTISVGAAFEAPIDTAGKTTVFACARRSLTDAIYSAPYRELFNTIYAGAVVSDSDETNTFEGDNKPEFYFQDANVKLTFRPSTRDVVNFSLYASRDQLFVQYADTFSNETVNALDIIYSDENTKRNRGASFRWNHQIGQRWQSSLILAASSFDGQSFSTDTIYEPLFGSVFNQFSSEERNLDDFNGRLEFAGNYRRNKVLTGLVVNRIQTEVKLNNQGVISDLNKSIGVVSTMYAENNWTVIPGILLSAGIRLNYFDRQKRFMAEPRCRFSWILSELLTVNVGFGRNNQYVQRIQVQNLYLNRPDIWQIAGAGETNVLTSDQLAAGLGLKFENLMIRAEGFKKWNANIAFAPDRYAEALNAENSLPEVISGNGTSAGIDLLMDYFKGKHHVMAGYTLLKSTTNYGELSLTPIPEFFEQRHEIKTAYELKWKRWSFSALWVYGSGRPFTRYIGDLNYELPNGQIRKLPYFSDLNSARLPEYHRMDVSVSNHFMVGRSEFTISAAVYNLYNRRNIRDYQYTAIKTPSDEFGYTAGVKSIAMIGILPSLNLSIRF
jgi:hypothetical protein